MAVVAGEDPSWLGHELKAHGAVQVQVLLVDGCLSGIQSRADVILESISILNFNFSGSLFFNGLWLRKICQEAADVEISFEVLVEVKLVGGELGVLQVAVDGSRCLVVIVLD